ncbi:hypothetical protein QBC46DRAFT_239810, partial [Diplogelasinospora grovesii]
IVREFAHAVHAKKGSAVYIKRTEPGSHWDGLIDLWFEGDCDDWVRDLGSR